MNLLHPLSLQCHFLLRLIPMHQTPLSTHACISPAHPRCCRTHLRCHSAPLYCTANTNLQVCSTIASGCTFYLAEILILTDWCGSFVEKGVWYRITSYCTASSYVWLSGRPDPPTISESSKHHNIFTIFTTCKCLVDTYTTTTSQNFALCIKISLCPPSCTCTLN